MNEKYIRLVLYGGLIIGLSYVVFTFFNGAFEVIGALKLVDSGKIEIMTLGELTKGYYLLFGISLFLFGMIFTLTCLVPIVSSFVEEIYNLIRKKSGKIEVIMR